MTNITLSEMKNVILICDDPRLIKWLRLLGVDARLLENTGDVNKNEVYYVFKSPRLWMEFPSDQKIYIGQGDWKDQLRRLNRWMDLRSQFHPFQRCSTCNTILVSVPREEVVHQLPLKVRERFHDYYRCDGCGRVYWAGTHYERIVKQLEPFLKGNI